MTDERMEHVLGAWMRSSVPAEPDARVSAAAVLERLDEAPPAPRRDRLTPFLQAAASLAVLAIIGGTLLFAGGQPAPSTGDSRPGIVAGTPGAEPTPAGSELAGPPIHWQSDEVDLRADGLRLRVGEDTYVGRDADFWLEAGSDGERYWWISAAWDEGGEQHLLKLDFGADADDWWIQSVRHERPDIYGPDGTRHSGLTWLDGVEQRYPLGRTATGDLRFGAITLAPTCEQLVSTELGVSLELDGLRLAVEPRASSPLEELADSLLGPRSRIGRVLDPPPEPQARFVELECPAPETVSVRLNELELQVEPVGEGALRVLGDRFHDLDQTISDIAVGRDGTVVVATIDGFGWLGSPVPMVDTSAHMPFIGRVSIGPGQRVLATGGERLDRRNSAIMWDGEQLETLPRYGQSEPRYPGSSELFDPSWDAEDRLWVGATGGVGSLLGDGWEHHSRYEYAPIVAAHRTISHGATRSLAADPSGDLWVGNGQTFSQHHDGRWIEHDPLREVVDALVGTDRDGLATKPYDLKIDDGGTMWALTSLYDEGRGDGLTLLVRRRGEAWSLYPFESVLPAARLESQHIAVHDGAVYLLVVERTGDLNVRSQPRVVRFDGTVTEELARLPAGLGYRLEDVGPDGTVWIVGGSAERRHADRIHIVPPNTEMRTE